MNRKIYNNKSNYDPGRFRILLKFLKEVFIPNTSGGGTLMPSEVASIKAIELSIREGDQLVLSAAVTNLDEAKYFIIRKTESFTPMKDMIVTQDLLKYTIRAVVVLDMPIKYYKILVSLKR